MNRLQKTLQQVSHAGGHGLFDEFTLMGIPYSDAFELIQRVKPEELRPVDFLEFSDGVKELGFKSATGEEFTPLLSASMGMLDFNVRCFFAFYKDRVSGKNQPVFLGTSHQSITRQVRGVKTLCGFAWDRADKHLSRKWKSLVAKVAVEELCVRDTSVDAWQCFVHNSNRNTLQTWRFVGKYFKDDLQVIFTPLIKDYTLVFITRRRPA